MILESYQHLPEKYQMQEPQAQTQLHVLLHQIHAFVRPSAPPNPVGNSANTNFSKNNLHHRTDHRGHIANLQRLPNDNIRQEAMDALNHP